MNINNLIFYRHFPAESTRIRVRIKEEAYRLLLKKRLEKRREQRDYCKFYVLLTANLDIIV